MVQLGEKGSYIVSEVDIEQDKSKLDKTKELIQTHWKGFTIGVVITGVTFIVAKRVIFPNQTKLLIEKMIIKDNVFLIETYARRMGPPGYLIECLETNQKWVTQGRLAREIGKSPSYVSSRFKETNGAIAVIDGYHYIRRAVTVPRAA